MRELVAYAAKYHVQIIPEIEMPGHEVAAIHAYPELTCHAKKVPIRTTCGVSNELLCPGNEFTYEFLGNVFNELSSVLTSPYVHLGGDEAVCRPRLLDQLPQMSGFEKETGHHYNQPL